MVVAFEGLDCSGKTTSCSYLRDKLNSKLTREDNASVQLLSCRDDYKTLVYNSFRNFNTKSDSDRYRLLTFMASHYHTQSDIENIYDRNTRNIIILDRSYYSTIAYHNKPEQVFNMFRVLSNTRNIKFPYTINELVYLDISPSTTYERLKTLRHLLTPYETERNLKRVYDNYNKYLPSYTYRIEMGGKFDVTHLNLSLDILADIILERIRST